ncbi:hypothetical protein ILUMI_10712 [Ignelater luminosus]|uniref:CCHC-type domain-containing protein n=1 Tax=Ignelater luminosus TaxID=2038154 RepID=A0A8K0D3E3_IGNLU|nr:hypothetical protein ILUMI_10712 [Ignelater luminosus]
MSTTSERKGHRERKGQRCYNCGSKGHNSRFCDSKSLSRNVSDVINSATRECNVKIRKRRNRRQLHLLLLVSLMCLAQIRFNTIGFFAASIKIDDDDFPTTVHVVPRESMAAEVIIGQELLNQANLMIDKDGIKITRRSNDTFLHIQPVEEELNIVKPQLQKAKIRIFQFCPTIKYHQQLSHPSYTTFEIPDILRTDDEKQYELEEFHESNGLAEHYVQEAKTLLDECLEEGSDVQVALLHHRDTPRQVLGSPVLRLMSRRTKTLLPINNQLLFPKIIANVPDKLQYIKVKKKYYAYKEKEKSASIWVPATIVDKTDELRSVVMQMPEGSRYRRNTWFLEKDHSEEEPEHHGNEKDTRSLPEQPSIKLHQSEQPSATKVEMGTARTKAPIESRLSGGKTLAKKVVRNCIKCFRYDAKPISQPMGHLPVGRTLSMHPFHSTGIDYADPYSIKDRKDSKTLKRTKPRAAIVNVIAKSYKEELVNTLENLRLFTSELHKYINERLGASLSINVNSTSSTSDPIVKEHPCTPTNEYTKLTHKTPRKRTRHESMENNKVVSENRFTILQDESMEADDTAASKPPKKMISHSSHNPKR